MNSFQKLLDFLNRLDDSSMPYTLEHEREDTVLVSIAPPGERWEVEFYQDGTVEVEVFYSTSAEDGLEGEEALERLFADYDEEYDEDDEEGEDEDDDADEDEDEEGYEDDEDEEEEVK